MANANDERLERRGDSRRERPPELSPWARGLAVQGRDWRFRLIEPGIPPPAHRAPARVGRLRAYGNAINAEQAHIFIEAGMSCMP